VNIPTYRVRYAGNFTNISPYPFLGTYHGSELPMVFGGATPAFGGRNATSAETQTSNLLQLYLVAFASDPEYGLSKLGWPMYKPGNGNTVVVISPPPGSAGLTSMNNTAAKTGQVLLDSGARYDELCAS
jgi:carboxylesterase type B